MLPPRHHSQAKRAFLVYWSRRFISERMVIFILLLLSVAGMVSSQMAPQVPQQLRAQFFDSAESVLATLSYPLQRLSLGIEHVAGLSTMSNDLAALREENTRLKQWYDRARQLEAENRSLRSLVNLNNLPRTRFVSARVIAEGGGSFAKNIVVDAGKRQGVTDRMVAMSGDGVIGRVIAVGETTAQILLITDVNSRVPVVVENSRHRGVVAGDNDNLPHVLYLPEDAALKKGERVLTSGRGGIFASGLLVGVIADTTPRNIRVVPSADLRRLDVLQLMDFGQAAPDLNKAE